MIFFLVIELKCYYFSPFAEVVSKASAGEETIYAEIDLEYLETVRKQIPIRFQRRDDLYAVTDNAETQRNWSEIYILFSFEYVL